MIFRMKPSPLPFLVLLLFLSPGTLEGFRNGVMMNSFYMLHKQNIQNKGGVGGNGRKMVELEAVLDYDYAGPNTKHDPRGRKGGNGKNP
nr:uncharacterized protein LOC108225580 [Ipomoea batatas]GMC64725.1 uncharacterized protein LOC108225580 [Ipomoea batatas]